MMHPDFYAHLPVILEMPTFSSTMSVVIGPLPSCRTLKPLIPGIVHSVVALPLGRSRFPSVRCGKTPQWEPSPVIYAPVDDADDSLFSKNSNIFETLDPQVSTQAVVDKSTKQKSTSNQSSASFFKWPFWLLGPAVLLATGMVPTLWLPTSSIFLGPNIASLLSLIGLDCIFNLGASLFLLMADSCARPNNATEPCNSQAPFGYQFWNLVACVVGFFIPVSLFFISQKGLLQPEIQFIPFAILLGPYLLLLSVQILTETLTWHWQSPVWLVTPVVYEAYRLLQLMRGLKLGLELSAPAWMMHAIRGLVCWWVLILSMQLMRVAWYAGVTSRARQQDPPALAKS